MNVSIITTFSKSGYDEYAKFLVDSLVKYLDKNVKVYFYLDDMTLNQLPENMTVVDFHKEVPELKEFRSRNKSRPFKNFLYDACRFSFKSYAWCHAGLNRVSDTLIWLDADCELYNNVSAEYLISKVPTKYFTSHLARSNYTETGFLGWNLTNNFSKEFFTRYKQYYDDDSIYELPAYTDCHVYDAVVNQMSQEGKISAFDLSPPGITKDHLNMAFKGYFAHYKGDRISKRDKMIAKLKGKNA